MRSQTRAFRQKVRGYRVLGGTSASIALSDGRFVSIALWGLAVVVDRMSLAAALLGSRFLDFALVVSVSALLGS